jgi:hypothetical protein
MPTFGNQHFADTAAGGNVSGGFYFAPIKQPHQFGKFCEGKMWSAEGYRIKLAIIRR